MNAQLFSECHEKYSKNAIYLTAGQQGAARTRIGGNPLVPADFRWPAYTGGGMDGSVKERPLSFIAQIDCAEIHALDADCLLPESGILSFFYELDSQEWGYEPQHAGCSRVYWFADADALKETAPPADLAQDLVIPQIPVSLQAVRELPENDEIGETDMPELDELINENDDVFEEYLEARSPYKADNRIKLLGYADIIQNDMHTECVRSTHPYFISRKWADMTDEDMALLHAESAEWILLFQMDMVEQDDFELMFGDCGRIYFYIRKDDLAARRFERAWLMLQCY